MGGIIFYIIVIVVIVKISKKSQKNNSAENNHGTKPSNVTSKTTVQRTVTNVQASTTDMLRRKAEKDQANHDKEKRYEEYKQKKMYKGKKYAQRYLIGDSVPRNMKIKCCGYCGAENLITYGNREQLLCYFCREEL